MKNNFRLLVVALAIIAVTPVIAQKYNIGIGTTKPDQSAVLDISSSTKGLLMPRMSLQQRGAIQSPAQGLVIYQTDFLSGFYFYDGNEWKSVGSEKSVADANNWGVGGNSGLGGTNFLGTTDNVPLIFKIANTWAGYLAQNSNTLFGFNAGVALNFGGTTGNTGFGFDALKATSTGGYNTGLGYRALATNTTGTGNIGIGGNALVSNTTGADNMAIGLNALALNVAGSSNMAIGSHALYKSTGIQNTAVGSEAGFNNIGHRNVFIGYTAGYNEAANDKLYIANSNTALPLVYGDFSAKFVSIGDVGVVGDPAATLVKRNNLSSQYGLLVQKGILTEKIKVATLTSTDWADYVFDKDYKRMSLEDVEQFVTQNKHLPNVPTTSEMMSNGSDLIKTDAKLLEKIEELTLYMIEMNKEIKALKVENAKMKK